MYIKIEVSLCEMLLHPLNDRNPWITSEPKQNCPLRLLHDRNLMITRWIFQPTPTQL